MLTLLRHLLLVGVLFGLAGNGVASASTPCNMMTMKHAAAMADMPDCDMAVPCPDCHSKHSNGTKPGCTLMTSCAFTGATKEPAPGPASLRVAQISEFWPVTTVLAGRIVAPEPEPPSLLG